MQNFYSVADLKKSVGTILGRSRTELIDQGRVDGFANVSGDKQWIHIDVEKAAFGPYGHTIAHGLLTVAVSQHLAHEVWDLVERKTAALYGFNKLRFPAPVPVPSQISVVVELLSVDDLGDSCRVMSRVTTEALGVSKPVCVSEPIVLFYL